MKKKIYIEHRFQPAYFNRRCYANIPATHWVELLDVEEVLGEDWDALYDCDRTYEEALAGLLAQMKNNGVDLEAVEVEIVKA